MREFIMTGNGLFSKKSFQNWTGLSGNLPNVPMASPGLPMTLKIQSVDLWIKLNACTSFPGGIEERWRLRKWSVCRDNPKKWCQIPGNLGPLHMQDETLTAAVKICPHTDSRCISNQDRPTSMSVLNHMKTQQAMLLLVCDMINEKDDFHCHTCFQ